MARFRFNLIVKVISTSLKIVNYFKGIGLNRVHNRGLHSKENEVIFKKSHNYVR